MRIKNISKVTITLTPVKDGGIVNVRIAPNAESENPLLTEAVIAPFLKRGHIEIVDESTTTKNPPQTDVKTLLERMPEELTAETIEKEFKLDELKVIATHYHETEGLVLEGSKTKADFSAILFSLLGV